MEVSSKLHASAI